MSEQKHPHERINDDVRNINDALTSITAYVTSPVIRAAFILGSTAALLAPIMLSTTLISDTDARLITQVALLSVQLTCSAATWLCLALGRQLLNPDSKHHVR